MKKGNDLVNSNALFYQCMFFYAKISIFLWKFLGENVFLQVRLGYCSTSYQRLRLYNGAPFSHLLRYAGDTEDVFSA